MKVNYDAAEVEQYLRDLSGRVRALRARRGMTRKDLAKHTGISERYLAQLENGDANPSVELLWRIVQAMGISFQELVTERPALPGSHPALADLLEKLSPEEQAVAYSLLMQHFSGQRSQMRGVALIGLRGAGKTTLGRALSDHFGVPFIKLGDVIENLASMELSEVFSLGGQKTYRRLERQAVNHVVERYSGAVIEAGGSLVSELETFNVLRGSFFTVWVRAKPEDHMNRVVQQGDLRPMEGNEEAMEDLRRILVEREPYYGVANYMINTSGRSAQDCLTELERVCRPYLRPSA